ncbi:MAG: hypothetical protein AUG81_00505 [Verrucomicrobia bacterium 13_1_20CM_4_54_11]|nr:MAG: hypothetical protein AUG81_00505 [Verrucomicrobia bacterium 13_1_20CM_4_54_11]
MRIASICILYTQDGDLARRVKAFLRTMALVRHVTDPNRMEAALQQNSPAVILMDLRAKECRDLLEQLEQDWSESLVIALGALRSEPLREAEQSGIYAAEDLQLDRHRFQTLVGRAFDHLEIMQENRDLREQSHYGPPAEQPRRSEPVLERAHAPSLPLLRFPRVFRRLDNVEGLLASIVEGVADAAGVTRVGIFSRIRQGDRYRLRAGLRCLPETNEIEYHERDPLVRWFELHGHLVSRANLAHIAAQNQRPLLRRALDSFGAEVMVPLYARGEIIGWLFFGHRITGLPFDYGDLEGLMILAEHVSTVLENALLYEEVTLQKTLAETLLKSIPPGIVAIDEDGLEAKANLPPRQWIEPNTRRSLSVESRRLLDHHTPLGAVAVIHDLTAEENLRQKQDLVDRAAFWTDLAASMSHEIRNPLVAIKTFAQLLPERFDDPEFRKNFNQIVVQEIDRLDKIITQINAFAHPAELKMRPLDIRTPVKRGLELARSKFRVNGDVAVETELPANLPKILGDEGALAEAVAHLVANAAEAVTEQKKPKITLSAKPIHEGGRANAVLVTVQDNGHGIAPEMRGKVFSPFCTTKARGMGLGLPIVKRTVFDHNGRVDIDTSASGTAVSIALPATANGG